MKHPPAFQFYANDFVTGTTRFTTTDVGGYILLLCEQWDKGAIPGDSVRELAQVMRCSAKMAEAIWTRVSGKFVKDEDGQWRNARLERVRAEQLAYRAKQVANGSKGGRQPSAKPTPTQKEPKPNPTPKPNGKPNESTPISDLRSTSLTESKNDSVNERPPRDLLAVHDRLFRERYEQKPPRYGAKEAAIAKRLIHDYGFEKAAALVEALFDSRDAWIQSKGRAFSLLANTTTQTELIAAMSGRSPQQDGLDGLREFVRG